MKTVGKLKTMKKSNKCLVSGCDRNVFVTLHGLCRPHYERYRTTGNVGLAAIITRRKIQPYKASLAVLEDQ